MILCKRVSPIAIPIFIEKVMAIPIHPVESIADTNTFTDSKTGIGHVKSHRKLWDYLIISAKAEMQ